MKKDAKTAVATAEQKKRDKIEFAVAEFNREYGVGVAAIGRAAKIYAETVAAYGKDAEARFRSEYPNTTDAVWDRLRRIGSGDMPAQAMFLTGPMYAKAERMSPTERKEFFKDENGVYVYNQQTRKPEFVAYRALAPRHQKILYKPNGSLRTMDEQIAYVEETSKVVPTLPKTAWTIEGDTLFVHRRCCIGKNELTGILARMK